MYSCILNIETVALWCLRRKRAQLADVSDRLKTDGRRGMRDEDWTSEEAGRPRVGGAEGGGGDAGGGGKIKRESETEREVGASRPHHRPSNPTVK